MGACPKNVENEDIIEADFKTRAFSWQIARPSHRR